MNTNEQSERQAMGRLILEAHTGLNGIGTAKPAQAEGGGDGRG